MKKEETNSIPKWKRDRWDRIDLVNSYVMSLREKDMVLVAFLMMRGLDAKNIMTTLSLDEDRYNIIKERLAFGLLFMGLAVRD
jgi:hypothetical protein